jgi:hypothetical protein
VAGGWWLVAGGWWLVAGGWWLVAGGWWLGVVPKLHAAGWDNNPHSVGKSPRYYREIAVNWGRAGDS